MDAAVLVVIGPAGRASIFGTLARLLGVLRIPEGIEEIGRDRGSRFGGLREGDA